MSKQREAFKTTFKDKYNMRECQTPLGIKFVFGSTETAWSVWQQAQKVAVPDGFLVVPREPTQKMIDAGVQETDVDWKRLSFGYEAMIEAVDQPV